MIEDLLQQKIATYAPSNALEQEHALAELMQHYVLAGLARAGFFARAFFQGGTCLRILFGMRRFSEDLDFMLKEPDPRFAWKPYLGRVGELCAQEGIRFELQDRSKLRGPVKKAFLKTDSVGKLLLLELPFSRDVRKTIRIKLEIDTNPPRGSTLQTSFIRFPVAAALTTQSLESGFGTKSHALLCRSYVKGRDWYDLLWYIERGVVPDLALLQNALEQLGPWAGKKVEVDARWYLDAMRARIEGIDWRAARADVVRFVPAREQEEIELWGRELFLHELGRLARRMR